MPSTEERESQPVLGESCPKCGSGVVIRNWKGQFFAKCKNTRCTFEFDSDNRGKAAAQCPTCGTGRLRTTSTGRICADCGTVEARPTAPRAQVSAPSEDASALGTCPKCKLGKLAVRSGAYGTFVSCSERCGLTYSSDEQGVPEGGICKSCQGPVKKTQNGSKVCAVCGGWQNEKPAAPARPAATGGATLPPKPKAAKCPRCGQLMGEVFTKRQKWAYRCDPCQSWFDA